MMMFGSNASTYGTESGAAVFSLINEVIATTVPAGTLHACSGLQITAFYASFPALHSKVVPSTQMQ